MRGRGLRWDLVLVRSEKSRGFFGLFSFPLLTGWGDGFQASYVLLWFREALLLFLKYLMMVRPCIPAMLGGLSDGFRGAPVHSAFTFVFDLMRICFVRSQQAT